MPISLRQDNRLIPLRRQILVQCVRAVFAREPLESRLDVNRIDWPSVVVDARRTGLSGLLADGVRDGVIKLPAALSRMLRQDALVTAALNIQIESRFAELAALFASAGVPVMALKGVVLVRTVYERSDYRPMADIDLLVGESDAHRAQTALEQNGYQPAAPLVRPDFFPRFYHEVDYRSDGPQPVKVDLHARPFRPAVYGRTVNEDSFWASAERMAVGASWVAIPNPERMLLHLMIHAACHGATRAVWLMDIWRYATALQPRVDWDAWLALVAQWRVAAAVRTATVATENLWGSFLPAPVHQAVLADRGGWQERLALRQAPRDTSAPLAHVAVTCLTGHRGWSRLAYLRAVLFPSTEHMATIYGRRHRGWRVLAHMVRLMTPLWRAPRLLLRILRRAPAVVH